ncbi:MAG: YcaO-like family protein [Actinomycetota bacterium]
MTSATSTSDRSARRRLRGEALGGVKAFRDGTHRVCSPEETIERYRPAMEHFGITRLADVTGLDRLPISTIIAVRPNARTLASGSGKGTSKSAATASALMEALEIAHAEQARPDVVFDTHRALSDRAEIIDVEDLVLAADSLFSVNRPERWVAGWDIVAGCEVYVPQSAVDFSIGRDGMSGSSFNADSNGLASGNTLGEAVLAGLYEVIERDATTCWRYASTGTGYAPPRVDLSSITPPSVRELIQALERCRFELHLFDLTLDTAVPTYGALIVPNDGAPSSAMNGYGTHLDPAVAMSRAITEAVQARAVYVAGTRDDVFDHRRELIKVPPRPVHVAPVDLVDAGERVDRSTSDLGRDLEIVLDNLREVGLDRVVVVDLREPTYQVPVVRVIVPGLEGAFSEHRPPGRRGWRFTQLGRVASSLANAPIGR